MLNEFKISAVVPTKNRSYDLLKFIDSLIIQNYLPYELIVVYQSDKSHFIKIQKKFMPLQQGDVQSTYANVDDLIRDHQFQPDTKIEDGIRKFLKWYMDYYGY